MQVRKRDRTGRRSPSIERARSNWLLQAGLQLYYKMLAANYTVSPHTYGQWGDWNPAYPEPRTPDGHGPPFVRTVSSITAAAMVVQNFDEARELALATGRVAEAAAFDAMLPGLRRQYHASFYDPVSQSANSPIGSTSKTMRAWGTFLDSVGFTTRACALRAALAWRSLDQNV